MDRRTDIFAFGAVLYEMLTARPAFDGETVGDVLAAVIRADPDWSRLPRDTSAALRRLLRRCLHKDRSRRIQTAVDVRNEIEDAQSAPEPDHSVLPIPAEKSRHWLPWVVAVSLFFTTIALAFPAIRHFLETPSEAPEMSLEINTPSTPDPLSFAISPDGRQIVFVASGGGQAQLWLRPLNSVAAQPLNGTNDPSFPFWSPDSRSIGFFSSGKLKRIDVVGGGLPRTLANAEIGRGGTWSPDGTIVFRPTSTSGGGLWRRTGRGADEGSAGPDRPSLSAVLARRPSIPVLCAGTREYPRNLHGFIGFSGNEAFNWG